MKSNRLQERTVGEPVSLQYFDYERDGSPIGEHWARMTQQAREIGDAWYSRVWVQPPMKANTAPSNGYNPADFLTWDSDLGTEAEFKSMVSALHGNDVAVDVDAILNHTGMVAPEDANYEYFDDREYYHDPEAEGRTERQLYGLWALDHENPDVTDHLHKYVQKIDSMECDGVRWDAAKHIPKWFFDHFAGEWATDLDLFTVGEVVDGVELTNQYAETGMKVFDYPLHRTLEDAFAKDGELHWIEWAMIEKDTMLSINPDRTCTFVENHDKGAPFYRKLAYAFTIMAPGHPFIYSNVGDSDGVEFDEDWLVKMIELKRTLGAGDMQIIYADEDLLVYNRDHYIVAINSGGLRFEDVTADIDHDTLVDATLSDYGPIKRDDGTFKIRVPRRDYAIYVPEMSVNSPTGKIPNGHRARSPPQFTVGSTGPPPAGTGGRTIGREQSIQKTNNRLSINRR